MKLALAIAALVVASSCLVNRRSEDFECTSQAQCDPLGRVCTEGFCVKPDCPDGCDTCDPVAMSCGIDCSTSNKCGGTVSCPAGYDCTIQCTGVNACNDIRCEDGARSCAITCSGNNACDNITCAGGAACTVTCSDGECSSVDCVDACSCELICPTGTCAGASCPQTDAGADCIGTAPAGACDPTFEASCNRC